MKLFRIYSSPFFWLLLIVVFAVFLRSYHFVENFEFAHDGDLYSWVVKDVVFNKHFRLIGQETSTPGIFIGPFFYYLLIPFFYLTKMDPVGVLFFSVFLAVLVVLSYYFVFKRLFDQTTGFIAALVQSFLLSRIMNDRWVVPTVTTSLWGVWYLYVLIMLVKGNNKVLPLLGLLIGLIWHINLSLAPTLIAVPIAFFLSKRLPKISEVLQTLILFLLSSLPYFVFESRHNFSQSISFLRSFTIDQGGGSGIDKFVHIINQLSGNVTAMFFYPERAIFIPGVILLSITLLSGTFFVIKSHLEKGILIALYSWFLSLIIFFTISSKIISEYYFSILDTIFITFFMLALSYLYKLSITGRGLVVIVLTLIFISSMSFITWGNGYSSEGYYERKMVVDYISRDAQKKVFLASQYLI